MGAGIPSVRSKAYSAALAGSGGRPRTTPADAFQAAVDAFQRGPRLDMVRLAGELGVSKATLYRWTGSREQLIGEVLAYLAAGAYSEARAAAADTPDGTEYWVAVTRHFMSAIVAFEPLRRFVREETPLAFRVLTMRGSVVQATVVRRTAQMLEEAQRRGAPALRAPAPDLAYAMTKVGEGFIYSDPVANVEPDVEAAIGIMRLLLE
jgi:AcrR family transcriptional regulator